MTVIEQIIREAESLSVQEQREALRAIKSLRSGAERRGISSKKRRISAAEKRKLHPALRAIAGMWEDRTDLPKDGAKASMALRRRLMGRSKDA